LRPLQTRRNNEANPKPHIIEKIIFELLLFKILVRMVNISTINSVYNKKLIIKIIYLKKTVKLFK